MLSYLEQKAQDKMNIHIKILINTMVLCFLLLIVIRHAKASLYEFANISVVNGVTQNNEIRDFNGLSIESYSSWPSEVEAWYIYEIEHRRVTSNTTYNYYSERAEVCYYYSQANTSEVTLNNCRKFIEYTNYDPNYPCFDSTLNLLLSAGTLTRDKEHTITPHFSNCRIPPPTLSHVESTSIYNSSKYTFKIVNCKFEQKIKSIKLIGTYNIESNSNTIPYDGMYINNIKPMVISKDKIYESSYGNTYNSSATVEWNLPFSGECGDTFNISTSALAGSFIGKLTNALVEFNYCDLKISSLTGTSKMLNPTSGGSIGINGSITDSSGKPISWAFDILDQAVTGSGTLVHATWNGKYADGTAVEPGEYRATLTTTTADGQCKDSQTIDFTVTEAPEGQCGLYINFGSSAHMASGNLSHSQELFSARGGAMPAGMTLYYNTFDHHNGSLGRGWSHVYDVSLKENANGSVLVSEGNWRHQYYTFTNGVYSGQPGNYAALAKNSSGSFTLTDKDGQVSTFSADGKLASNSDRNGNTTTLAYSGGNLTSVTDPIGRMITFTYDNANHLTSVVDPSGNAYSLSVGSSLNSVTQPDGGAWGYSYDVNSFMLSKTDPIGNRINYSYDDKHRVITSTDPEGLMRNITYPQTAETVKSTTFTEKDGGQWSYSYETQKGYLLAKTDPQGGTTSYGYDANGNRTSTTNPDGTSTSAAYDNRGNMLTSTDAMGQSTSYSYNAYGQITSIIDPQGGTTVYGYDTKGNMIALTDPAGAATTYAYDAKGNVTKVTDSAGQTTNFIYDAKGNLTSVADVSGATTSYVYDAAGNTSAIIDPKGSVTKFVYDSRNRLIKIIDPSGSVALTTYDTNGNKTSETDANGNVTKYKYNSKNQIIKTTDALNSATTFAYGGSSCPSCGGGNGEKLTSLTDANGNFTSYLYDQLGRLVKETGSKGNETNYAYDAKGNLTSRTDSNRNTIGYSYDGTGRLLKKTYPDASEESFTYDIKGNILSAANRDITYSFSYDAAGRMMSSTDSSGRVIGYEYDLRGNKTKMTAPDGKILAYTYDNANRLNSIVNGGTYTFGYDTRGQRTSLAYPNGDTATYAYDKQGRLTNLVRKNSTGTVTTSNSYTMDKIGNRQSNTTPDRTSNYSYDPVYRLIQAITNTPGNSTNINPSKGTTNAVQEQMDYFSYDPVGNRLTSANNKSYSYGPANQLTNDNSAVYSYDKNGNLIEKAVATETSTYFYDFENRLIRVTTPATTSEYAYDPFGRRISKKITESGISTTTNYFYDGQSILFDYDENGAIGNRYIHGPNVDEPLMLTTGKDKYYYHADGLGSIIALTDTTGKVVQTYDYDSFGNLKDQKNRIKQPFTYTGREWDKEIGLYYYRARYYDPMEGRFIQKDPIGYKGGINLYNYVGANPINWIDPKGLSKVHGQWCGGDWTGGQNEQYSPEHDIPGYYSRPRDALDGACQVHDKCYYKCREDFPCDKKSRGQCFLVCDAALDDAALTAGGLNGNLVSAAMRRPGNRVEPNPCSCGGILGE